MTLGGSPLAISGPMAADSGVTGTLAANIATGIVQIGSTAQPNYGTVVLSGTNTYSGGTWVQSGTLVAANPQAIGLDVVVGDQTPFTNGPPPAGAPTFARGMLWSYRCGDQPMDVSPAGVVYATGSATESADDLGLGQPTRLYSTNLRSATAMGPGWMLAGQPYLQQVGNSVAVIFSPQEVYNFVQSGGADTPECGIRETLAAGPGGLVYLMKTDGTVYAFNPLNTYGDARDGSFVGQYSPDGSKAIVTALDSSHFHQISQIQYFVGGSSVPYQTLNIAYNPGCGLENTDRVASLTLFGPDGTTIQRQVVYTYYASSSNSGGELQSAAEFAGASFVGMSYYRYSYRGLLLALTPQDVANAVGAGLDASDTLSALGAISDNQLASYASASFTYNPIRMVKSATLVTVNGAHSYEYTYGGDLSFAPGTNWYTQWLNSVCEVMPDGSTLTVYCNGLGQTMLTDLSSPTGGGQGEGVQHWVNYEEYSGPDTDPSLPPGLLMETASPSAIAGYDPTSANLGVTFNATGLIDQYSYASATSAAISDTVAGNVAGYLQSETLADGTSAVTAPVESCEYFAHMGNVDVGGGNYLPVTCDNEATDSIFWVWQEYGMGQGLSPRPFDISGTWVTKERSIDTLNAPPQGALFGGAFGGAY